MRSTAGDRFPSKSNSSVPARSGGMRFSANRFKKYALWMVGLPLAFLLAIPWLGWPWHLIHGETIASSGIVFKIPARYFSPIPLDDNPAVMRTDFGLPLWHAPYGFITIFQHRGRHALDFRKDIDRIQSVLVTDERSAGMNLIAQRKFDTAIGEAVCFEFGSDRRSIVDCYFDKSTLSVDYEGSNKFGGDMYEVVNSARRQ